MDVLLTLLILLNPTPIFAKTNHNNCRDEILANQSIYQQLKADIDGDSFVEEVVLYGDDVSPKLHLLMVEDSFQGACIYITSNLADAESTQLDAHTLEIVELTGSNPPEIHLAYDVDRQSKRSSEAKHHIFSYVNNNWKEVFVNGNCLHLNYFEFQGNPQTLVSDIYTENDPYCDDPWPSQYAGHALFSWDDDKFVLVEQGNNHHFLSTISIWQQIIPFIPYILLTGLPISAFAFGFFKQFIKPKQNK